MSHGETEGNGFCLPPSKRAARRLIQRAFVLTGRDKHLRQHLRAARLTTLWNLQDWDLVWTVIIDRGRIEFDRRPAKHPDLTLSWETANEFFSSASLSSRVLRGQRPTLRNENQDDTPAKLVLHEGGGTGGHVHEERASALPESSPELAGNIGLRRIASHLLNSFLSHLGHVLRNPVDGAGESLL